MAVSGMARYTGPDLRNNWASTVDNLLYQVVAVGESSVILLHPPCTFIRCFDRDTTGGVIKMTVSPTALSARRRAARGASAAARSAGGGESSVILLTSPLHPY